MIIDFEKARLARDAQTKSLRAELHIEWRGEAYQLNFVDHENQEPDLDWMYQELCHILERNGYIVPAEELVDPPTVSDKPGEPV